MERLRQLDSVTIREKKEYVGIPPTWNLKPEFCLAGPTDEELFYIISEKKVVLGAEVLKTAKSLTLYMVDPKGEELLYFEKRFGFFKNKLDVFNADEELLGTVLKKKTAVKVVFHVLNQSEQLLYRIEGSSISPDSFNIRQGDEIAGKFSKRWGKTLEEGVSKQDHFGLVFPMNCGFEEKKLLLGALLLLDFLY